MKKVVVLFSMAAIISVLSGGRCVHAATCTLTIGGAGSGVTIFQPVGNKVSWVNSVTIASGSHWATVTGYYNNLTLSTTYSTMTNPYNNGTAPPDTGGSYSFDVEFLTSGSYECYCIDAGYTSNMSQWSDSTNHIYDTINAGP